MSDLKKQSILIFDRGYYTYLAEFMAKHYGKVYYHNHVTGLFLESPLMTIGTGIEGVEVVEDFTDVIDKVDVIFFPYIYDGKLQCWLRDKGYTVCGSGKGEKMELDKAWFLEQLHAAKLPVPPTYRAEGLDDLWDYVKDKKGPLFLKNAEKHRGDWETRRHDNKYATEIYLNKARIELGVERSKEIEILVQSPIESACETGIDGFMLDGEMVLPCAGGYEIKDQLIVLRAMKEIPDILKPTMEKLGPIYKKLGGYQGPYHNEARITKAGKVYPIDETCRCGSPPTAVLCEMYGKNYAEIIRSLAHGEMPKVEFEFEFGAEVILSSHCYGEDEIHVGFPPELSQWVKLNNARKKDGQYRCIPNKTGGLFGSVCAVSNKSWQDAVDQVKERMKDICVDGLTYQESCFYKAEDVIKSGETFGIDFGGGGVQKD